MLFAQICQKLIDAWVSSPVDPRGSPELIFAPILNDLSFRMRLSVIDLTSTNPLDWQLRTIRHSKLSSRFLNLDRIFKGGRLGDLTDQAYLQEAVLPKYNEVIERRQPLTDVVETKLLGIRVVYDRIILPEKCPGKPCWLITCTHGRFMTGTAVRNPALDATDEDIILHLLDGCSVKEIAAAIHLSPRTVEHRLERLKKQLGARSLPQLAALIVAAGLTQKVDSKARGRRA